jgi:hypothetical protein
MQGELSVTSQQASLGYGNSKARTQAKTPIAVLAATCKVCIIASVCTPLIKAITYTITI